MRWKLITQLSMLWNLRCRPQPNYASKCQATLSCGREEKEKEQWKDLVPRAGKKMVSLSVCKCDIGSTYQEENNKNTLRVVWTCVDDTEGTSEKNRSHEFYSNEKE